MKKETLEEVLGSSMCQFSVVENKLAKLYRNQVKIYEAITKKQERSYSEEEVVLFIHKFIKEHQPQLPYYIGGINMWFEQFKKK